MRPNIFQLENNICIDCGEIELSKIINHNKISFNYIFPSNTINKSSKILNFKKIFIKVIKPKYKTYFNIQDSIDITFQNSIFANSLPYDIHIIPPHFNYNKSTNIIVEITHYRRLTHFGRQCNPRVRPLFDDSITDDCILDCFQKRSIDRINCIPYSYDFGFTRLKRYY